MISTVRMTIILFTLFLVVHTVLAAAIKAVGKPGDVLQNQLDKINHKMDLLNNDVAAVLYALDFLEKTKPDFPGLVKKMDKMSASVSQLESTNQVWKSNFRSIKDTIAQIRKKLSF